MSLGAIALRGVLAYLYLLLVTRVSGKRTIGQATPLDFVVALIVGDLIDDALWAEVSVSQFIVAAGVVFLAQVTLAAACCRWPALESLVQGRPRDLVRNGETDERERRRQRLSCGELMALFRMHGTDDLREVERGVLESSGRPGVLLRPWAKQAEKQDLARVRHRAEHER
jgi:uncharacterized membrane protein YcaP (DUF421 family)